MLDDIHRPQRRLLFSVDQGRRQKVPQVHLEGVLYKFRKMCPENFYKDSHPMFAKLRELGHNFSLIIDDAVILADSPERSRETIKRLGKKTD